MAAEMTEARLRKWMEETGPRLIALATGICRDRHQAEEIVQEAFVKLWRKPPEAGEIAYTSWLRRVVTNASINALQRTKRPSKLPEFSSDPAMRQPDREDDEARDDLGRVRAAMDRLDPAKRSILYLRGAEGLSYEQIARHLDIPVGTVMSRLNRARLALQAELAAAEEDEEDRGAGPIPFRRYMRA